MKSLLVLFAIILPLFVSAQGLNQYQWKSRVLILFTPEADDPLFLEQYQLLGEGREAIDERDVQMLFISPEGKHENTGIFLDESQSEWYYNHFSVAPYQFEMVLVGLDGTEKFRARNTITPVSVIANQIDQMPMRKQEMMRGYGNKSTRNVKQPNKRIKKRY